MREFKTKLLPFARGFLNCESNDKLEKTVAGILMSAKEMPIYINPKTGICDARVTAPTGYFYGTGICCFSDWVMELAKENPDDREDFEYVVNAMEPWMKHDDGQLNKYTYTEHMIRAKREGLAEGGNWVGHAVPNFIDIAKYGTDALREKIEYFRQKNPGKDGFYDAVSKTTEAYDILGERFSALASEMLEKETDPDSIENLKRIVSTFDHAPKLPCRDFAEAVIVFVLVFAFDGVDSPGWFDQFMYDFWKVTEPKLRRKYLEGLWEYFHETRTWNLTISGSDENWNDLSNDLTYEILDVVKMFKYETPNLTLRCHRNTPERIYKAAYEALCAGNGIPAIYNDEAVCAALENQLGIPPVDSHKYVMNGCNQIDIQGKSHMGLNDGELSIAKAVELALRNGVSLNGRDVIGLKTGDPTEFKTFDEFFSAVLRQIENAADIGTDMSNACQEVYAKEAQNPIRSAITEGCLEKGLDYKCGGPIYNHGQMLIEGIADAADSVASIKKYVFEEKRYTMAEVLDALQKNYEGYDEMYHTFKHSELKFGNDIEYVDSLAVAMTDHLNRYLLTLDTYRGGKYSGGCSPFMNAPSFGGKIGALPNGKKRGESMIADSIGATPGCDTNGPTALLNSCLKFNHALPGSGFILNLKFDKDMFCSNNGEATFTSILKTYFEGGGQMLTFTVVSEEDLRDAQVNPDAHRDLIVRVGGYSDYFVNLSKSLQENVLARTSLKA